VRGACEAGSVSGTGPRGSQLRQVTSPSTSRQRGRIAAPQIVAVGGIGSGAGSTRPQEPVHSVSAASRSSLPLPCSRFSRVSSRPAIPSGWSSRSRERSRSFSDGLLSSSRSRARSPLAVPRARAIGGRCDLVGFASLQARALPPELVAERGPRQGIRTTLTSTQLGIVVDPRRRVTVRDSAWSFLYEGGGTGSSLSRDRRILGPEQDEAGDAGELSEAPVLDARERRDQAYCAGSARSCSARSGSTFRRALWPVEVALLPVFARATCPPGVGLGCCGYVPRRGRSSRAHCSRGAPRRSEARVRAGAC